MTCTCDREKEGGFGVIPPISLSRFDLASDDDDHHIVSLGLSVLDYDIEF